MQFKTGQKARRKSTGDIVIIVKLSNTLKIMNNLAMYQIQELKSGKYTNVPETDLEPYENKPSVVDAFKKWKFGDYFAFRKAITHIRVRGELTNVLYSMHYGDVEFKPHQFKPVMKFLQSTNGRILIADEVGLGKTIEALYIWKELQAREDAKRVLVVCPHSLVDKWVMDMRRLFSITDAQVVDSRFLINKIQDIRNFPATTCSLVTGIESIRSKEKEGTQKKETVKDKLRILLKTSADDYNHEKLFDLVIVDEAHIIRNYSTCNFKTIELLRENSKNLVLLSATPIQTSSTNLFTLMRMMEPEEYDNKYVFNEILSENEKIVRLSRLFYKHYKNPSPELSDAIKNIKEILSEIKQSKYFGNYDFFNTLTKNIEEKLLDDELRIETYNQIVHRYFYDNLISRTRKKDVPGESKIREAQTVSFELNEKEKEVYRKVTTKLRNTVREDNSKVHEFVIMLKQREMASSIPAALKKWSKAYNNESETSDLYEELFGDGDDSDISIDYAIGDLDPNAISNEDIIELEKEDSKYNIFKRSIISEQLNSDPNEKIIVFSFFTATLEYLERRLLHDGYNVLRMDGSIDDRTEIIRKFKEENYSILLSSEVGSEGLDMQFARIEVNYDLPWNPMRLEQRIGRIDRIGQKSQKINIVNLICNSTVEDKVLSRLYERINIFKNSIGELDEILGTMTTDIQRSLLNPTLTEQQMEEQAEQMISAKIFQKIATEDLEENAGISKEYSDLIMSYIQQTSNNNRFIRREDLIHYIEDFFYYYGQGSTITNIKGKDTNEFKHIVLSQEADIDYMDFVRSNKHKGYEHHANIGSRGIDCCFPQGKQIPHFIPIDINDSLIRWIYEEIEEKRGMENPYCFALKINRENTPNPDALNKGIYIFLIKEINFIGIKVRKELLHIVMDVNNKKIFSVADGEYIVSQALFFGESLSNLDRYKQYSQILNDRIDKCERFGNEIYDDIANGFVMDNDTAYKLQLNKIEKIYDYQRKTIVETMNSPNASEGVRRMNQGRLDKLEERFELQLKQLAKKSSIQTESSELATGIIIIP